MKLEATQNSALWCVGGGASTNAKGTINADGTGISFVDNGAGYSAAPQVVVTGGGWHTSTSGTSARGDYVIGSSDGVLLYRGYTNGNKTYISSTNPNQ